MIMTRRLVSLLLWWFLLLGLVAGLAPTKKHSHRRLSSSLTPARTLLQAQSSPPPDDDNNGDKAWDGSVNYDEEWPDNSSSSSKSIDPATRWDDLPSTPDDFKNKLGIDLDLAPLTEEEAAALQQDAEQVINDAIADGIEDIERLRTKMKRELDKSRQATLMASELKAQQASEQLLSKIDQLTNDFLQDTQGTRESTKLAAKASKAMENSNKGIEMGTWGTLGGRTVLAEDSSSSSSSLLGSVENAKQKQQQQDDSISATDDEGSKQPQENRILVIADTKQDEYAKKLLPKLMECLEQECNIPNLVMETVLPTATMPLGGNNAACVVAFLTSVNSASSLKNSMVDRLLRKTLLSDGKIGVPPTQLVGISTLGTERVDQFPYSLQNLMGGGKLETRRQLEENLVSTVNNRVTEPALDYTIVKVGELKETQKDQEFQLQAGDVLDGSVSVEAAARTIAQAIALQPYARNRTLCVTGDLPASATAAMDADTESQLFWESQFLVLEGPELWRTSLGTLQEADENLYQELVEYVQQWGELLATSKGLTTPIQVDPDGGIQASKSVGSILKQQDGVQLLFLPTKTGKNYLSKSEERQRESDGQSSKGPSAASLSRRIKKEGGIDVVVEITRDSELRVRARRCNYANDAVIKELSEATILKRLQEAISSWKKEHNL